MGKPCSIVLFFRNYRLKCVILYSSRTNSWSQGSWLQWQLLKMDLCLWLPNVTIILINHPNMSRNYLIANRNKPSLFCCFTEEIQTAILVESKLPQLILFLFWTIKKILTRIRVCEQLRKFCEHNRASTCLKFASKLSKSQILWALETFDTPFTDWYLLILLMSAFYLLLFIIYFLCIPAYFF